MNLENNIGSQNNEHILNLDKKKRTASGKVINPWIERLKGLIIYGGFYASQYAVLILAFAYLYIFGGTYDGISDSLYLNMVFTIELTIIIVLIAVYRFRIIKGIKDAIPNIQTFILKMIVYIFIGGFIGYIFIFVDETLFPNLISEAGSNQEGIEAMFTNATSLPIPLILMICITGPIIEEYTFRYGIISKLLYGFPKYLAPLFAALIFAGAHVFGFGQLTNFSIFFHLMLTYLGSALAYSYIYAYEENIFYPIMLHIFGNTMATLAILSQI